MADPVLIDSGPLVALLNRNEHDHPWVLTQFKELHYELQTCEAVLSESFFLVRHNPQGIVALLDLLNCGVVCVSFPLGHHLAAVTALMRKYHDVPMSLADACLVRMSELHDQSRVFTLDSDFKLYRRHGRQAIPLLYPAR
jgi:uncharacterized protein